MEEKLKQVVGVLLLCTLIFILWMFFGGPFDTYYLLWNLFLAWIPLGMALLLINERKKEPSGLRSLLKGLIAALWLFFFPNAVYVITDFIHLSQVLVELELKFLSFIISGNGFVNQLNLFEVSFI